MFKYNPLLRYIALWAMLSIYDMSIAQAAPLALFADAANTQSIIAKPNRPFVSRSRYVSVNTASLLNATKAAGDAKAVPEMALNLFADANFTGVVNRVEKQADTTAWIGTLKNIPQSYFYMVTVNGAFIAHIGSTQGIYEVSSAGNNVYKIIQIEQSKLGDDAPGDVDKPGAVVDKSEPVSHKASLVGKADTGATIDVLVVYTADARIAEGSTDAMKARIALAMTETNDAYTNSGTVPRLRLVHTEEVNYTESGNLQTDVDRLIATNDGYMDNVHTLRDTYGADMVSLIEENGGGYCGLEGAIMATAATAFDVVVRDGCMTGYYSFAHDFAHLQGARHDVYMDPTLTPYAYGHGYVHQSTDPAQRWRTIMAYNRACTDVGYSCPRLQYFSNPGKSYLGAPMGITGSSEDYNVLNATRVTVANFRPTVIDVGFDADFNNATAVGWVPVNGTWTVTPKSTTTGFYTTTGIANASSSSYFSKNQYNGIYGDFTLKARIKRLGSANTDANRLIIRGNPTSLSASKQWQPSYLFQYTNAGFYSVTKVSINGTETALKGWTQSSAILKGDWNVLKVIAVDSILKFYINGTLVWSGTDSDYATGNIGVGMYRNASSTGNQFRVDWINLTNTPTADSRFNQAVTRGTEVSGGTVNQSPAP